ncbi:MAG: metallophosphoesterase [bacterium]|nr:metallophosphoesterase [bacterium]
MSMINKKIALAIVLITAVVFVNKTWITRTIVQTIKPKIISDFSNKPYINNEKYKTSSNIQEKYNITLISDIHNNVVDLQSAIAKINQSDTQAVIVLGDLTNTGTRSELLTVKKTLGSLNKKYYVIAGDHDLWASREHTQNPQTIFDDIFKDHQLPPSISVKDINFIRVDNADIYNGVSMDTIESLSKSLSKGISPQVIVSHKAIYNPLTLHKMGYINEKENKLVLEQALKIQSIVKNATNQNVTLVNGDLHSFSKYKFLDTLHLVFNIGAITKFKNFQNPRYAVLKHLLDGTVIVEDKQIYP